MSASSRLRRWRALVAAPLAAMVLLAGCPGGPEPSLPREALLDPATCQRCHPAHYEEWQGSMHAYAADDPVFIAMNARGQRETDGALGDFCVRCHAPMAVAEGLTADGLNLDEVPQALKGVTCYFCHQVAAVEGIHNNPLRLAGDTTMRGGIEDPLPNEAHPAAYSPIHDRRRRESAEMCGACHDIVTPSGVHLERTFAEWLQSIFSQENSGQRLTCGQCHMTGRDGIAADVEGVGIRRVHDHSFPGVDLALTEWPGKEAQRAMIQAELDSTVQSRLCVTPDPPDLVVEVVLENFLAGHNWPSGAAQDRRAWIELVAYEGDSVVYESGRVPEGEAAALHAEMDPDFWLLRDRIFDGDGHEVHMFWEAQGYESELLAPVQTLDRTDPRFDHASRRTYRVPMTADRITLDLHLRPMGLEVLDDLIAGGDLDPSIRARMPTFTLAGPALEWRAADGFGCVR
ncbi:MAG: hypothetical protein D6729_16045 [Deltaproteobacteria bacterium]|nr:MAG: hypothetical protein D6729_16045 [Deltaproteobacteria bacterium]